MTKHELLAHLRFAQPADAHEVAHALAVTYPTAAIALLRLVRQGLSYRRVAPRSNLYSYSLSPKGNARFEYFEATDGVEVNPPSRHTHHREESTMKLTKKHSGTFHCPACFVEVELYAEASLKCETCGGPLAKGTLDEVWSDDEDEG